MKSTKHISLTLTIIIATAFVIGKIYDGIIKFEQCGLNMQAVCLCQLQSKWKKKFKDHK